MTKHRNSIKIDAKFPVIDKKDITPTGNKKIYTPSYPTYTHTTRKSWFLW